MIYSLGLLVLWATLAYHERLAERAYSLLSTRTILWRPRAPLFIKARRRARIAIDVRPAQLSYFGVGSWIRGWVSQIPRLSTAHELILVSSGFSHEAPEWALELTRTFPSVRSLHVKLPNVLLTQLSRRKELDVLGRLAGHVDEYHANNYLYIRPIGARSLMTVFDLSPWRVDGPKNAHMAAARRYVGKADITFTLTDTMKRLLLEMCPIDEGTCIVAPGAAGKEMHRRPPDEVSSVARRFLARSDAALLDPPRYFLYTGSLNARKNFDRMLTAFEGVRSRFPEVELWLVGPDDKEIGGIGARSGVRPLGYVAREDLAALYSGSLGLIYVSLHEGFGLPVVEAFATRCPVLTSRDAALLEVGGGAALTADALDVDEIRKQMCRLVSPDAEIRDLVARGAARAEVFSWERTAGIVLGAYDRLRSAA